MTVCLAAAIAQTLPLAWLCLNFGACAEAVLSGSSTIALIRACSIMNCVLVQSIAMMRAHMDKQLNEVFPPITL